MRAAAAQRQADRREVILDAARRCFARSGFHQTSMQSICAEAGMSPGGLYRYFPSKEAIIAGIAERDRANASADFAAVTQSPDFFTGLDALARQYLVERTDEEIGLCAEIMAESRRNPEIARIYRAIDDDVKKGLANMLRIAAERGELPRDTDFERVVDVLLTLGDGVELRRSIDPTFDSKAVFPLIMQVVRFLLVGCPDAGSQRRKESSDEA